MPFQLNNTRKTNQWPQVVVIEWGKKWTFYVGVVERFEISTEDVRLIFKRSEGSIPLTVITKLDWWARAYLKALNMPHDDADINNLLQPILQQLVAVTL